MFPVMIFVGITFVLEHVFGISTGAAFMVAVVVDFFIITKNKNSHSVPKKEKTHIPDVQEMDSIIRQWKMNQPIEEILKRNHGEIREEDFAYMPKTKIC